MAETKTTSTIDRRAMLAMTAGTVTAGPVAAAQAAFGNVQDAAANEPLAINPKLLEARQLILKAGIAFDEARDEVADAQLAYTKWKKRNPRPTSSYDKATDRLTTDKCPAQHYNSEVAVMRKLQLGKKQKARNEAGDRYHGACASLAAMSATNMREVELKAFTAFTDDTDRAQIARSVCRDVLILLTDVLVQPMGDEA